ncbi:MAG: RNA polymerase sigma factor [Planctomycetes bacterium]|nr:RNA polymerase sigma factor [Planctomycetota bacterium]
MNDRALARLFRRFRDRHDGAALAAVFDATARELFEVACHLNRDLVGAEDLVQATFVTAIAKARDYDEAQPVKAWLYGILWREAAKTRRELARRVDPVRLHERVVPEPIDGLIGRELPDAVASALEGLPRPYREVLEPLLKEEQRPEEIAARLKRSPGTIRSQIHRGLERLRRALPAGLAGMPAVGVWNVRGLGAVRGEVLHAAGFSPAVAAGASVLVVQATIGGWVMSKIGVGAAALALAGAAWFVAVETGATDAAPVEEHTEARVERASASGTARADAARERESERSTAGMPEPGTAAPAPDPKDSVDWWLARFNAAPNDWRHGWQVMEDIAALPPERGRAILRGVWPHLTKPVREQAMKPFVFHGGHALALEALHLGATDPELSVQERAFGYLERYAFRDFALDFSAYLAWEREFRGRPIAEVLDVNARRFAAELAGLAPGALATRMREIDALELDAGKNAGVDLAATLRDAGLLDALANAVERGDEDARTQALAWSKAVAADEPWLRTFVTPRIDSATDETTRSACFDALARSDCAWARTEVEAYLRRVAEAPPLETDEREGARDSALAAARAIGAMDDPAAIPELIGTLARDRTGRYGYALGHFALAPLTGVQYDPSHDAAWWREWWEKNAERLPPHVRALSIPR